MSDGRNIGVLDIPVRITALLYAIVFGGALLLYGLLWWMGRGWMVMDFDQLWKPEVDISTALFNMRGVFFWALGSSCVLGFIQFWSEEYREHEPGEALWRGSWGSVMAGFFEELIFRWLIFFNVMVTIRILNAVIPFGWLEWLFTHLSIPLANWATLGKLEPQLVDGPWVLGAAIVMASIAFRDAHELNGPIAWVNSWFMGMVLFYALFTYGMVVAILVHIIYDLIVFTINAGVCGLQRP